MAGRILAGAVLMVVLSCGHAGAAAKPIPPKLISPNSLQEGEAASDTSLPAENDEPCRHDLWVVAELLATAVSDPDGFPAYVRQDDEAEYLARINLERCLQDMAWNLYFRGSGRWHSHLAGVIRAFGADRYQSWSPAWTERFLDATDWWIGSPYLLELYLRDLARLVRAIQAGDDNTYYTSALYRQSTEFWEATAYELQDVSASAEEAELRLTELREDLENWTRMVQVGDYGSPPPSPPPAPRAPPSPPEPPPDSEPGPAHDDLPAFPWPPPKASDLIVLSEEVPEALPEPGVAKLGAYYNTLKTVLKGAGYKRLSVYEAPDGFVLVTRIERTDENGNPEPQRWLVEEGTFGMWDRLKNFFFPEAGYFRVLVFAVASESREGEGEVTRDEAERWLTEGATSLPRRIRSRTSIPQTAVTALIYDFEQPTERQPARQRSPRRGGPDAQEHLERACGSSSRSCVWRNLSGQK